MGYLASPFWLMQLVVGILIVLQVNYARAGILHPGIHAVSGLAAVRPRTRLESCSP